ncbi:MAG: hypothetical protein ACREAE_08425 [Nitrosopumilaceae archaeon]
MWAKGYFPAAYWPSKYWPDPSEDIVVIEEIIGGILKGKTPPKDLTHLIKWIKKEKLIKSGTDLIKSGIDIEKQIALKEQIRKAELIKQVLNLKSIEDEEAIIYILFILND